MVKKEEKEKIEVEKEFLDLILKSNKDTQEGFKKVLETILSMKQEIAILKPSKQTPVSTESKKDYVFKLTKLIYFGDVPKNPIELAQHSTRINDFRKRLLILMKTYRIGQIDVAILKRL